MDRRAATSVIFAGFFFLGMVFILWGVLLPDLAQNLAMNEVVSGAFFTLISIGMILGAILGGKYAQKFDFMSLFAVLLVCVLLLLLAISFVQHWFWLLVGALVLGMFASSLFTIGHTVIARLHVERRSAMMGFMDFMFSLGTLAAPFFVSGLYLIEHDWRWPLRILAAGMLVLAVYTWRVAHQGKKLVAPEEAKKNRKSLSYGDIIRRPVFIFLALAAFGYGMVEFGNANWFVSYAQNGHGFSGEQSRLIFAFFTAGMVVSRLVFALLLKWLTSHRLMLILATIMVTGCFMIKLAVDPVVMSWGNFMLGLGLGGLFPLMLSAAMDVDSDKGPIISGLCVIGSSIGVQVASFSTGLWAHYAPLVTAFWVIPIGGAWLWAMTWAYSRFVKRHIAQVKLGVN
ncbi:MFS transporter [Paraglaciecola agarilytica]|uniref:MFS transporter n=1 Tax=Paraglaciecola chathamensis TaxID=368405 RepID=UPI001C0A5C38|nr:MULTISPECIES: MFS transporter [Paraglaciecola]MBU3018568.1 MFS transporter [Paraglaciecola agarilytica]MDO6558971.1 MFS transporter [Paraglaciecola chathamensis]